MARFGDNLKHLRLVNGLSQREFAEKLSTTQQRVSEWERNLIEPSLSSILKIIKVLDVTFEELTENIE
ncbi:MAG: helix-turn-helix transcriptional regulator [Clostridia bacterium]|nr:helix-turn-helix transcriptional regulator [Clostridia bacterium]